MHPAETDAPSVDLRHGDLEVSGDGRFLQFEDGTPFFYLGDTAWELFHRLTLEEAEHYLENRRRKRFTVIQAVALAELDGLRVPNAYGDLPLVGIDPTRPSLPAAASEAGAGRGGYWGHVDRVIDCAARKGMFLGLLPTWGDKVTWRWWGRGPVVFDPASARSYGEWIGSRYADRPNIIWILGGDRPPRDRQGDRTRVWRAMAEGIRSRDARHLVTYHPSGGASSSRWLHGEGWLDFNMIQSGHFTRRIRNHEHVRADYARLPPKPTLDGEPAYEDHAVCWFPPAGWFGQAEVRRAAWQALMAGAAGHTYGCHPVWQMMDRGRTPVTFARRPWREALDLPGAFQMTHVRSFFDSRSARGRVPDQGMLPGSPSAGPHGELASHAGSSAFVYLPEGFPVEVRMDRVGGRTVKASWFDPRTGGRALIGSSESSGLRRFTPPGAPGAGNDWVLVLEGEPG